MTEERRPDRVAGTESPRTRRMVVLVAFLIAFAIAMFFLRDWISLSFLASRESQLREVFEDSPTLVVLVAAAIYVVVTGLSLPGAAILSLVYGWFLGFWIALVVISFASTAGASLAFLLTRYLFRDWMESRFKSRLASIQAAFDREGAYYLFTLRLVPAIPFFVINAVMGLTRIRLSTFWWVSQLGMLPGTVAYVYAGSQIPSLQALEQQGVNAVLSWQLALAFVILGVLPLAIKRAMPLIPREKGVDRHET